MAAWACQTPWKKSAAQKGTQRAIPALVNTGKSLTRSQIPAEPPGGVLNCTGAVVSVLRAEAGINRGNVRLLEAV